MFLELLQRKRHGWVIKRTVKWPIQQLIERRHKHKQKVLEGEKLQTNVYIYEPEQALLLGDSNDEMNVGLIPTDDATNCLEDQHGDLKIDSYVKPHLFKSNHWFLDARYVAKQQIDREMKQVVDELENDGPNVNMRVIAVEVKFLE